MKRPAESKFFLLFVCCFPGWVAANQPQDLDSQIGHTLIVAAPKAELRIGTKVVAKVRRGERFKITGEQDDWLYVRTQNDPESAGGWIGRKQVRVLHPVLELLESGQAKSARARAIDEYAAYVELTSTDPKSVDALNRRGLAELATNDSKAAVETFRVVVDARKRLRGNQSTLVAEALNNLGVSLFNEGRFDESKSALEQAVQIQSRVSSAVSPESIQYSLNLMQFERFLNAKEPDWELQSRIEQAMLSQLFSGSLGGATSAAVLMPMRTAEILHPTLKLSFSAAGFDDPPRIERPVPPTAEALWWLERLATLTGAHEYLQRCVVTSRQIWGENHFRTGVALANLGAQPKFPFGAPDLVPPSIEAERLQALELAIKNLEPTKDRSGLVFASVQRNMGVCLLSDPEQQTRGLQLLRQALASFQQHSKQSLQTGLSHELLGLGAYVCRDFSTAVEHLSSSHKIEQGVFGIEHPRTTATLNSLGVSQFQLGNIETARTVIENALQLRQSANDLPVRDALESMNDLAVVLTALGDMVGARELFEYSIRWLEKGGAREQDPWLIQQIEMNLWVLRIQMGDYLPAQRYFQRVLNSPDTFAHKDALSNLATLARLQGDLPTARRYLETAMKAFPDELQLANDLGAVLREQGDWQRAEQVLTYVVSQRASSPFPDKDAVAFSQTSLALVEQRMGKYAIARDRFSQVLEHLRAELGSQSPRTIEVLRMLGQTELLAGNLASSQAYLLEAFSSKLQMAEDILPTLSEAEALAYVVTFEERDALLEALDQNRDANDAYDVVWKTRALATRALASRAKQRTSRQWSDDPNVRRLQSQLIQIRKELSSALLGKEPEMQTSWEFEGVERIRNLSDQKESLERQLASVSEKATTTNPVFDSNSSPDDLLAALPVDVAVVDLLRTHRTVGMKGWYYEAFVLNSTGAGGSSGDNIQRIELGSAADIDKAVSDFRQELIAGRSSLANSLRDSADSGSGSQRLRDLVWKKIEPYLTASSTVVVIPDGALTAVPWCALPAEEPGKYLVEDFAIATVAYPHQILDWINPSTESPLQTLLAGGIDYFAKPKVQEASAFKSAPTRGAHWSKLPATEREVSTIAKFSDAEPLVLRGTDASEARLKAEMPNSRFIHLATHGFFADPQLRSATLPKQSKEFLLTEVQQSGRASHAPRIESLEAVMGRNPLALSGIVLAGASVAADTNAFGAPVGDDGVLTAEEVASLDLGQTDLAVLSACETGLGTVAGGEGVFGLQRAFAYAGARSTVSSLWKVDDSATATLMEEFYRNLWIEKMSKVESLRQAQLWMFREQSGATSNRARGKRLVHEQPVDSEASLPPYFWASFVLSGDWQ